MHRRWLGEIYEWAGECRGINAHETILAQNYELGSEADRVGHVPGM
jgi:fido (protein-threonine AMPylation protein)